MGIEPTSSAWKADILADVLYPQLQNALYHNFAQMSSMNLGVTASYSPSLAALDSPLWDGAFGMTVKFPAKVQSLRVRQRLPPRGSWQNRQVLTEGVRSKPLPVKK